MNERNWDVTRNDIEKILQLYGFDFYKGNYEMCGTKEGHLIYFTKTQLFNGNICITVGWDDATDGGFRGGSTPCYSFEEVKEKFKEIRKKLFNECEQLSLFDL